MRFRWIFSPPSGGGRVFYSALRRGRGYFAPAGAKDGRHHFFSFPSKEKKRFRASKEEKGACWQLLPNKPRICIASAMRRLLAGTTFPHAGMPATELGIKKKVQKPNFQKIFRRFLNERRTILRTTKRGARPVAGGRGEGNTTWKTAFFLFVEKTNLTKDCNNKGFQNRRFWRLFGDFFGGEKVTPPAGGNAPAQGARKTAYPL